MRAPLAGIGTHCCGIGISWPIDNLWPLISFKKAEENSSKLRWLTSAIEIFINIISSSRRWQHLQQVFVLFWHEMSIVSLLVCVAASING